MFNTFKSAAAFVFSFVCAAQLHAQNAIIESDSDSHPENIIIHKNGLAKEKVTVVIDGNNVTVNGKPVDDFKSDNIDIEKTEAPDITIAGNDFNFPGMNGQMAPRVRVFGNDMMKKIKSNSAFLGVMSDKTDNGAKITDVTKGSAAEKAGLKEGDIITKINDSAIAGPNDLYKAIGKYKPEDKVSITYLRNGKQATTQATLGKSDQVHVYSWNAPGDNFNYNLNRDLNHNFSFTWNDDKPRLGVEVQDTEDGGGVKITNMDDDDAPAAKAGLKEDDIITQVNGKSISSVDDLKESLKDVKKGDTLKITYKRNNQTQSADVKFPKDLKTMDL